MHRTSRFLFVIFNIEKFDDDVEFVELDTKKAPTYNIKYRGGVIATLKS